jgi:hypothetical protein
MSLQCFDLFCVVGRTEIVILTLEMETQREARRGEGSYSRATVCECKSNSELIRKGVLGAPGENVELCPSFLKRVQDMGACSFELALHTQYSVCL